MRTSVALQNDRVTVGDGANLRVVNNQQGGCVRSTSALQVKPRVSERARRVRCRTCAEPHIQLSRIAGCIAGNLYACAVHHSCYASSSVHRRSHSTCVDWAGQRNIRIVAVSGTNNTEINAVCRGQLRNHRSRQKHLSRRRCWSERRSADCQGLRRGCKAKRARHRGVVAARQRDLRVRGFGRAVTRVERPLGGIACNLAAAHVHIRGPVEPVVGVRDRVLAEAVNGHWSAHLGQSSDSCTYVRQRLQRAVEDYSVERSLSR